MNWFSDLLPGLNGALNIHPLVVHFPIVLLPLACLLHFLSARKPNSWMYSAARWSLWSGTLGAAVAIAAGYLAAEGLGHDASGHDLVHDHRNLMVATGFLSLLLSASVYRLQSRRTSATRWALGIGHLALTVLLIVGSDRGAALVFRYGIGVQQELPAAVQQTEGEKHNHEGDIQPH